MNELNRFFDWVKFSKGKEFQVVSLSKWTDYKDKEKVLGTSVCCVITKDDTVYSSPEVSNLFEKIYFRIPASLDLVCKYLKPSVTVFPTDPACRLSGKPSGAFVNYNLSVECRGFMTADGKKIL